MLYRLVLGSLSLLWLLLGGALLFGAVYCASTPYESFADQVLAWANKPHWRPYFETRILPPTRYAVLGWLLGSALVGWGLATALLVRYRYILLPLISDLMSAYRSAWYQHWGAYRPTERYWLWGLAAAFLGRGALYLHRYELQYDEAWTYLHFVANGPLVAAVSPNNNHILYTLLATLTDGLPMEAKYSLRLPVLLGGLLLVLSAALLWRRHWSWGWTLVAVGWLAFCPGVSLYSLYARGYIFQLLFCCWGLAATLHLAKASADDSNTKAAWWLWSGSIILGMWSVPTHAYAALCMSVVLGGYCLKRGKIGPWLLANLGAALGTALLYAPYFLTNGWTTLWTAATTAAPQGDGFWNYQDKVTDWLLLGAGRGTPAYGALLLIVGGLGLGAWRQWKRQLPSSTPIVLAALLLLPTLLDWSTGVQPPYRVWCFLSVPLAWSIGWLGEHYIGAWEKRRLLLGLVVLGSMGFQLWRLEQHYALQWSAQLDREVKQVSQQLMQKGITELYLLSHYDQPLIAFYYQKNQQPLTLYMAAPNSQHYAPLKRPTPYQAVLWDREAAPIDDHTKRWLQDQYPHLLHRDNRISIRLSSN